MGKYKVDYRLADFLCGGSCLIRLISSTKAKNEVHRLQTACGHHILWSFDLISPAVC